LAITLVTLGVLGVGVALALLQLHCAPPQPHRSQLEADLAEAIPGARLLSTELSSDEVDAADLRVHYSEQGGPQKSELWHYVRSPNGSWRLVARTQD
jgi:hypothetical protein